MPLPVLSRQLLGGAQLYGVLLGGPARVAGEPQDDDEQGDREGQDADDHVPLLALGRIDDDFLFHGRRRIAANSRYAHARRRQFDGLFSGRDRTGHGVILAPRDYYPVSALKFGGNVCVDISLDPYSVFHALTEWKCLQVKREE